MHTVIRTLRCTTLGTHSLANASECIVTKLVKAVVKHCSASFQMKR